MGRAADARVVVPNCLLELPLQRVVIEVQSWLRVETEIIFDLPLELRNEVAAVDSATLALFLPQWHGLRESRGGQDRLLEVIGQLQDLPLPWSLLGSTLLPRRVAGFKPDQLDMLAATGGLVLSEPRSGGSAGSPSGFPASPRRHGNRLQRADHSTG